VEYLSGNYGETLMVNKIVKYQYILASYILKQLNNQHLNI